MGGLFTRAIKQNAAVKPSRGVLQSAARKGGVVDPGAVEAILVPALKAGFLLLQAGGAIAVLRELVTLARGRRSVANTAEKGEH